MKNFKLTGAALLVASAILVTGCKDTKTKYRYVESSSSAESSSSTQMAVVSTKGPGDASFATIDLSQAPYTPSEHNDYISTGITDYGISAYSKHFYHIGKYQVDTISKYSINNPTKAIWKFSTLDNSDAATNNPYELVFVNEDKAYLILWESNSVWIVNPSAKTQADFKIGELDISAYDDGDGSPEATTGTIIDSKLYLVMQRLESYAAIAGNSYIAVFDTETDKEIDTRSSDNGTNLKGIQLQTANPMKLVYHEEVGLFVQSLGSYGEEKIGGIEKINLNDYSTKIIIDESKDEGKTDNLVIVDENTAYFSNYNGWQNNDLCFFDPSADNIANSIDCEVNDELQGVAISGLTSDYLGRVWISTSFTDTSDSAIRIIDPKENHQVIQNIPMTYNPETVLINSPSSYSFK